MPVDETTIGTERRRSQRIPLAVPIDVTSVTPSQVFGGRCNTIDVSFHGCQFFITRPFKHGERLLICIPDTQRTTSAHVIRSMPAMPGMSVRLWKVAVDLTQPGNFWEVESPPPDWAF